MRKCDLEDGILFGVGDWSYGDLLLAILSQDACTTCTGMDYSYHMRPKIWHFVTFTRFKLSTRRNGRLLLLMITPLIIASLIISIFFACAFVP